MPNNSILAKSILVGFRNYPIPLAAELTGYRSDNMQTIVCSICSTAISWEKANKRLQLLTEKLQEIDLQLDSGVTTTLSNASRCMTLTNDVDTLAKELLPPSHFMSQLVYSKTAGLLLSLYQCQLSSWNSHSSRIDSPQTYFSLSMDLVRHQLLYVKHTLLCYQVATGQVSPINATVVSRKTSFIIMVADVIEDYLNFRQTVSDGRRSQTVDTFHTEMKAFLVNNVLAGRTFGRTTLLNETKVCLVDIASPKYNIIPVLMSAFDAIDYFTAIMS